MIEVEHVEALSEVDSATFTAELMRELPENHVLLPFANGLKAIGRVKDRYDFVFETGDSTLPFAVVHLTWRVETSPSFPSTVLCADEAGVRTEILDLLGL